MYNTSTNTTTDLRHYSCFLRTQDMKRDEIHSLSEVSLVTSIITAVSSIISILGNTVVITAIWKTACLHTSSNILLCSLAFADLLNALITQPAFVIYNIARLQNRTVLYCNSSAVASVLGTYLCGVSFLTLTGVSVDRFLALQLHLRYKELVRRKRVLMVVASCWILCSFCYVVPPIMGHYFVWQTLEAVIMVISLVINALVYCNIFHSVRKNETWLKAEKKLSLRLHGRQRRSNIKKFKKYSRLMAYVSMLYFLSYGPYVGALVYSAVAINDGSVPTFIRIYGNISWMLIFLNSTLNPFLFCYRIREIRKAIDNMARKSLCGNFCCRSKNEDANLAASHFKLRNVTTTERFSTKSSNSPVIQRKEGNTTKLLQTIGT